MSTWGNVSFYNVTQKGFGVRISGAGMDGGIAKVEVPTWSDDEDNKGNFQDDIVWYVATKQGNDYVVSVNIADHGGIAGKYHVHVYFTNTAGVREGLSPHTVIVPAKNPNTGKLGGFEVYHWTTFAERQSDRLARTTENRTVVHGPYSRKGNKIIAGKITQALNAIHEFTFTMSINNTMYQKMVPFQSIIEVVNLNDGETEFSGRVLSVSNKMTSSGFVQEVICEDFLSFFHDSSQYYQKLKNSGARPYLEAILNAANSQVEKYKRIKLGNVTVESRTDKPWRYLGYETTWDAVRERIVNSIGGYLTLREEYDGLYLDWTSQVGETKKSPIQLGRNIKSASREMSFDGLATQIMPIGADEQNDSRQQEDQGSDVTRKQVDIASVNNGNLWLEDAELVKQFGIIRKPVIWTEIDNAQVLKNRGLQYLRNQKIAMAKWTVSVVERYLIDARYEKFKIGNTHPILNAPLSGVETLQILEKKIDILNPQSTELTIGSQSKFLSAYQLQLQEADESIARLKEDSDIANKRDRLASLTKQLETLKNETAQAPTPPQAPTPVAVSATEAEKAAYEQAVYTYEIAKTNYDEKLANYNLSQEEKATTIANLEAEIVKLTNELKGV
ncbi:GBS Bsp-like repeat-containing protein [Streptococcus orisratti]|uniref:GBS Bsp-like repeat-containing protein n=1 Tax=Streptococcus orisratti TaxID=114652 RepID=UPI003CFE0072